MQVAQPWNDEFARQVKDFRAVRDGYFGRPSDRDDAASADDDRPVLLRMASGAVDDGRVRQDEVGAAGSGGDRGRRRPCRRKQGDTCCAGSRPEKRPSADCVVRAIAPPDPAKA